MIGGPRSLLARILLWHGVAVIVTALAVSAMTSRLAKSSGEVDPKTRPSCDS